MNPPPPRYRGRFAPSPTGPLHFGSLVAALGSWLHARAAGGQWLLRVEDIDPPREARGAAVRQLATLVAFGLEHDGEIVRQRDRGPAYAAALAKLLAAGDAFECRCSRTDLVPSGGLHRGCVARPGGHAAAVRLRVPDVTLGFDDAVQGRFEQQLARDVGDFVLRRADGLWAYQLAVVVDDADAGITTVVRGADLLDSTPRQILLQRRLGLPTPAYLHLPLVLAGDGRKLSKSLHSLPLDDTDPWPALAAAWRFLGQEPSAFTRAGSPAKALARALPAFDARRIPAVPGIAFGADQDTTTGT
ncbi:tRNA glutamyl-Q(34) synthetase GluQRS [Arenimonas composti]|uniref:Glutamyl-Q tRNA(Asp) synthetase n=1 Tax=Arenimonas composti TR7-09 = DSM 18010 TaxID=1121013 RepID=A0A091C0D0_9GAMM|nr:tRNA glutamyl-Q(34) synthetase GluQRS [Arenimonas composti]KFN50085.1 hypothetical protein P873_00915 [Arenimonas composti TR7-09 = DSM 18010]